MAINTKFPYQNTVNMSVGFNVAKGIPLDSRTVASKLTDLIAIYDSQNVAYQGMVVTVTGDTEENNGIYYLAALPSTTQTNWVKVGKGLGKVDNIEVNGVQGVVSNKVAKVEISGDTINLGSGYTGPVIQGVGSYTDAEGDEHTIVSPTSGDSVNEAVKKIVNVIIDDEEVIAAALNDLNDRVSTAGTEAGKQTTLTKGFGIELIQTTNSEGGKNYEVKLDDSGKGFLNGIVKSVSANTTNNTIDIEWNLESGTKTISIPMEGIAHLYEFAEPDDDNNVNFTTQKNDKDIIVVKGDVSTFNCGTY